MTPDAWVKAHPYLQELAQFASRVDAAAAAVTTAAPALPSWDDYAGDFRAGVPLLRSLEANVDLEPSGAIVGGLVESLAASEAAGARVEDIRTLAEDLRREHDSARRIADWLLGDDAFQPPFPGLLRYLAWTATSRYLFPLVNAFAAWRDDEKWLRNYCPTCGSPPAMAQLVGSDPGRKRLLSCGCCRTRWQYKRTACPFCESDANRLASVVIEGEGGLRIDSCDSCGGYLKTYDGYVDEAFLLSDWTSLHLDVIAQDRGLKRRAASLYEFELERHP